MSDLEGGEISAPEPDENGINFIDNKKETIYCGRKDELPFGYERKGESFECFKVGVGVGSVKSRDQLKREEEDKNIRVLSRLEILRLANRLGIQTVTESGKPFARVILLEKINNIMENMEKYLEKSD